MKNVLERAKLFIFTIEAMYMGVDEPMACPLDMRDCIGGVRREANPPLVAIAVECRLSYHTAYVSSCDANSETHETRFRMAFLEVGIELVKFFALFLGYARRLPLSMLIEHREPRLLEPRALRTTSTRC